MTAFRSRATSAPVPCVGREAGAHADPGAHAGQRDAARPAQEAPIDLEEAKRLRGEEKSWNEVIKELGLPAEARRRLGQRVQLLLLQGVGGEVTGASRP